MQKICPTDYNFLIAQDLWQAHYQMLLIILLKELIKLNLNTNTNNCRIKYKGSGCFLEYNAFREDLIEYKCLCCNKNYQEKFDENLKKRVFNMYKFSNHNINKFILLLQKCVYPYEYMEGWEKFSKISLPEKEDFYSQLNMGDITDADYTHGKKVCKDFKIKDLGQYHDLRFQSNTLFLADIFGNF